MHLKQIIRFALRFILETNTGQRHSFFVPRLLSCFPRHEACRILISVLSNFYKVRYCAEILSHVLEGKTEIHAAIN